MGLGLQAWRVWPWANLVVRPAAHVAAMYGGCAVKHVAELTSEMRAYWGMVIYIVKGERCGQ